VDAQQIRQVRLLISDVDPDRRVLSDDDVVGFLDVEGGVVKLAAAQALDAIASSEALVGKVIRTQDLSTDGAKVAESLRAHAALLRGQAADEDGSFDVVEFGHRRPELTGH
jgi:hypothetical protein